MELCTTCEIMKEMMLVRISIAYRLVAHKIAIPSKFGEPPGYSGCLRTGYWITAVRPAVAHYPLEPMHCDTVDSSKQRCYNKPTTFVLHRHITSVAAKRSTTAWRISNGASLDPTGG
jgi:hypothetical protein